MSNHFSADNLKFPGDDRRLDFTDLFVFTSPQDPDTTVVIIDSNPTSSPPPISGTQAAAPRWGASSQNSSARRPTRCPRSWT